MTAGALCTRVPWSWWEVTGGTCVLVCEAWPGLLVCAMWGAGGEMNLAWAAGWMAGVIC